MIKVRPLKHKKTNIDGGPATLSASFFPFGVLERKVLSIVSIPDHYLPFYLCILLNQDLIILFYA